jgi:hypothetical protein
MRKVWIAICDSVWPWVGSNHEQVKILFAVLAAFFVVVEYLGKANEAAVAKTLEYVKRFNETEIAAARKKLDAFLDQRSVEPWGKQLNPRNYDREITTRLYERGLTSDVRLLGHFYREVGLCVQGKICNAAKACHFFFTDIQEFMHNYKPYLEEPERLREGTPAILFQLVSVSCAPQHKAYCAKYPSPFCLTAT